MYIATDMITSVLRISNVYYRRQLRCVPCKICILFMF